MELEDQEGFNNTSNYPPKPYKSSSTKKYHGERPSIYNLNVPLNEKNLTQFLNSFDKTKSTETQLEFINVLLKASPDTLEKFAHTHGVGILARLLHESARNLSQRVELVDRILTYFNKVSLTKDMLTKSRIHAAIEDVKNSPEPVEEISNKAFKLLIKWRETIKEWSEEGGEQQAEEYERERRIARSFIKRTSRFSGEGKGDSRSPEDRSMDPMKRPRDARRMMRPRHDSFPRRGGKNYEGGHRYMRRNGHGHSDSEEDGESDYSERKTVKWNEEPVLVKVKYFRFNDEPTHRALTEEEVTQIQEKIGDESKVAVVPAATEDIKHKESQMEGRSLKMRRDNEKEIQDKLDAMVETIKWYRPIKLDLRENAVVYGRDSRENQEHQKRISTKLPCFYLKENQIPSQPSYDNVKSVKKDAAPAIVPLANSTADREPEENQDIFKALETFVQRNAPEGTGPATTTDKKPVQGSPVQAAQANAPKPVEQKEQKKVPKVAQPVRGILKKSREQIAKEREEAALLEEERRKEREKDKKGLSLDSDLVMKLMNGEVSQEEQEDIVNRLKENGDADGLLQNIATLRKFMTNVQQTGKPKKKEGNFRGPPHSFGQEPKKMMKPNTEPQTNMLADRMPPQQDEMPHGGHGYQDDYMDEGNQRFNRGGPGGPQGPMGMGGKFNKMNNKKVPFRPANYKTVPCVWFHSPKGCPYGDSCNFIHDPNHAGRQTPNMHKYVRPIDQLGTKGRDSDDQDSPGVNYPPSGNGGNAGNAGNAGPSSNFYGIGGGRDSREGMNVEKSPNMGMNAGPNAGGNAPYMNAPMNQNMHSGPGQQQQHGGYHRMNQPHHQGYHGGGHNNMNQMPYNNNRMGGPHHGGGGHHMGGGYHGGPHSHPGQHGGQHYGHNQGRQGDHGGYHGGYGGNQQQDHMMMRNEHNNYRNDMMYQPQQPQHNNPRMQHAPHNMPMQMGYNPMMMPPKGVMPPTGGGYGMMDPNKGKE